MSKLCSMPNKVVRAGTTCLTGNPANVSSFPITNIWHISITACSCCPSSPVACRPCSSCCALEAKQRYTICQHGFHLWYSLCHNAIQPTTEPQDILTFFSFTVLPTDTNTYIISCLSLLLHPAVKSLSMLTPSCTLPPPATTNFDRNFSHMNSKKRNKTACLCTCTHKPSAIFFCGIIIFPFNFYIEQFQYINIIRLINIIN